MVVGRGGVIDVFITSIVQVPAEFGNSRKTYAIKGSKVVRISRPKRKIDRRQATFQLTFCGGESQDVKPGICFRGKPFVREDGTVDPKRPKSAVLQREKFPHSECSSISVLKIFCVLHVFPAICDVKISIFKLFLWGVTYCILKEFA